MTPNDTSLDDLARDYADGPRTYVDLLDLAAEYTEPLADLVADAYRSAPLDVDELLLDLADAADAAAHAAQDDHATDYSRELAAARRDHYAQELDDHLGRHTARRMAAAITRHLDRFHASAARQELAA